MKSPTLFQKHLLDSCNGATENARHEKTAGVLNPRHKNVGKENPRHENAGKAGMGIQMSKFGS